MTKSILSTFTSVLSMLSIVVASPLPWGDPACTTYKEYKVTGQYNFTQPPWLMSGQICTSNEAEPCSLGRTFQQSWGIQQAVGISLGVEIKSVFNLGFTSEHAWSSETATATSVQLSCPAGDPSYSCRMWARAHYLRIMGTVQEFEGPTADRGGKGGGANCEPGKPLTDPTPFHFDAPIVLRGVNKDDAAEAEWGLCIANISQNKEEQSGLPLCSSIFPGGGN